MPFLSLDASGTSGIKAISSPVTTSSDIPMIKIDGIFVTYQWSAFFGLLLAVCVHI